LGVPTGPYLQQAEPEGLEAFEQHLSKLETMGCTIKRLPALSNIAELNTLHRRMTFAEFAREHAEIYAVHAPLYRKRTAEIIEIGKKLSDQELATARTNCSALRRELEATMAHAGIDLWVTPSAPGPAPEGIHATGDPNMNLPWTHAGMPAITLPAGQARNGLPLGLQFVARFGEDEQLLAWCQSPGMKEVVIFEELSFGFFSWPSILKERTGMHQVVDLYEKYSHGSLDRREFFKRLALIAGSTAAANALLPLLERSSAGAQIVAKDDARLVVEYMKYAGETGEVRANFVRPKGDTKLPAVLVIHENRGLNAHIEDVTRRIALEGFLAMAPDALSPLGGTPEDSEKAPALIGQLDKEKTTKNYRCGQVFEDSSSLYRKSGSRRILLGRCNGQPGGRSFSGCGCRRSLLWRCAGP
jgi:hypothetical protein